MNVKVKSITVVQCLVSEGRKNRLLSQKMLFTIYPLEEKKKKRLLIKLKNVPNKAIQKPLYSRKKAKRF